MQLQENSTLSGTIPAAGWKLRNVIFDRVGQPVLDAGNHGRIEFHPPVRRIQGLQADVHHGAAVIGDKRQAGVRLDALKILPEVVLLAVDDRRRGGQAGGWKQIVSPFPCWNGLMILIWAR